jgi:hypothetical protein
MATLEEMQLKLMELEAQLDECLLELAEILPSNSSPETVNRLHIRQEHLEQCVSAFKRRIEDKREEHTATKTSKRNSRLPSDLPLFKGDGTKGASSFLLQFKLIMQANSYPDNLWAMALATCIRGSGQSWAISHLIQDNHSWEKVEQMFLEHFEHPDLQYARRTELTNMRQMHSETVRSYADRFSELILALNDNTDSDNTLFLFRQGLRSELRTAYAAAVHAKPPSTLHEAIHLAVCLESKYIATIFQSTTFYTNSKGTIWQSCHN